LAKTGYTAPIGWGWSLPPFPESDDGIRELERAFRFLPHGSYPAVLLTTIHYPFTLPGYVESNHESDMSGNAGEGVYIVDARPPSSITGLASEGTEPGTIGGEENPSTPCRFPFQDDHHVFHTELSPFSSPLIFPKRTVTRQTIQTRIQVSEFYHMRQKAGRMKKILNAHPILHYQSAAVPTATTLPRSGGTTAQSDPDSTTSEL
jgi:hypothetical protein